MEFAGSRENINCIGMFQYSLGTHEKLSAPNALCDSGMEPPALLFAGGYIPDRRKPVRGNGLLGIGIAGTVIAAICCFTPALVLGLSALGLSAWLGGLDYVLLPALVLFITLTMFALWRKSAARNSANE